MRKSALDAILFGYALLILAAGLVTPPAFADCDPVWEEFAGGVSFDVSMLTTVDSLLVADLDGIGGAPMQLFVGGRFDAAGQMPADSLAAWGGSAWSDLAGGVVWEYEVPDPCWCDPVNCGCPPQVFTEPGQVWTLTVYDGQLIVAGQFDRAGAVAASNIAAWDGPSWSPLGTGVDHATQTPAVCGLAVFDPDGAGPSPSQLIATGRFDIAGSVAVDNIAAWNGMSWSALAGGGIPSITAPAYGNDLCVYDPDGQGPLNEQLVLAGAFDTAGTIAANNIAAWDGSSWSALGGGTDGEVGALSTWDADGAGPAAPELIAFGQFTSADGQPASAIASWDGATWSSLGSGLNVNAGNYPCDLLVHDLDENGPEPAILVVAGNVTAAGGAPAQYLAYWNGAEWSLPPTGGDASVHVLAQLPDGLATNGPALALGGRFTSVGGVSASRLAWRTCAAGPVTAGDLNCDGAINAGDIDPFVLAITAPTAYAASYPDCDIQSADTNGDGLINAGDIDPFVALLVGG